MREIEHDTLRYSGAQGEEVTVTVEPRGTVMVVTYTLNGRSQALRQGESITCQVPSVLQLNLDYSNPAGGSYRVGVKKVADCVTAAENNVTDECVHVFKQRGSRRDIKDFSFFAG